MHILVREGSNGQHHRSQGAHPKKASAGSLGVTVVRNRFGTRSVCTFLRPLFSSRGMRWETKRVSGGREGTSEGLKMKLTIGEGWRSLWEK